MCSETRPRKLEPFWGKPTIIAKPREAPYKPNVVAGQAGSQRCKKSATCSATARKCAGSAMTRRRQSGASSHCQAAAPASKPRQAPGKSPSTGLSTSMRCDQSRRQRANRGSARAVASKSTPMMRSTRPPGRNQADRLSCTATSSSGQSPKCRSIIQAWCGAPRGRLPISIRAEAAVSAAAVPTACAAGTVAPSRSRPWRNSPRHNSRPWCTPGSGSASALVWGSIAMTSASVRPGVAASRPRPTHPAVPVRPGPVGPCRRPTGHAGRPGGASGARRGRWPRRPRR